MPSKPASPKPPATEFVDDPHSPDIFADEAAGIFINAGTVRLTLASRRVDHSGTPGPVRRVVVGRLVMSVSGAKAMAQLINDFVAKVEVDFEAFAK